MDFIKQINSKFSETEIDKDITIHPDQSSSIGEKLQNNGLIQNNSMKYIEIKIEGENTIAEGRVCVFEDNIVYIQAVRVADTFQNNNIGTLLLKYILSRHSNHVFYINPTKKPMKIICKKHNFSKSDTFPSWYVKDMT